MQTAELLSLAADIGLSEVQTASLIERLATDDPAEEGLPAHLTGPSDPNDNEVKRSAYTLDFHSFAPPPTAAMTGDDQPEGRRRFQLWPERRVADRYVIQDLLGFGGTGEVWRVNDLALRRQVAMKVLTSPSIRSDLALRFIAEAQATAQLQHPGIVPVYDVGELPDGRAWFTMREVRGRNFRETILAAHRAATAGQTGHPWSIQRLVDAFLRVCEAIAYAHDRGVVHRDLKPENIMIGEHGEILVVDWGLAKVLSSPMDDVSRVVTNRTAEGNATLVGAVAGTPPFMAPEQARAGHAVADLRTDVYALGATLYQVLGECPPYVGSDPKQVLDQVRAGPPESLRRRMQRFGIVDWCELHDLDGLIQVCEQAMDRTPENRFESAKHMLYSLNTWSAGERRATEGRKIYSRAIALEDDLVTLRQEAETLGRRAAQSIAAIQPWQHEDEKLEAWSEREAERSCRQQIALVELEQEQLLHGALAQSPEIAEAHVMFASRYRALHTSAEAAGRPTARFEALLRIHVDALPQDHEERPPFEDYLRGEGEVRLVADPKTAEVILHPMASRFGRLVRAGDSVVLSPEAPVAHGTYACEITAPGHEPAILQLEVHRRGSVREAVVRESSPSVVQLLPAGTLGPNDCYVPEGWFRAGGDREAAGSLPQQRLWCPGFVMRRNPVTFREYLAFLDHLAVEGGDALEQHALVGPALGLDSDQPLVTRRGATHVLAKRAWSLDWPVFAVSWDSAVAFAAWTAQRTGLLWRLPHELEWEKAARGVDGRPYPWGSGCDPSWARMRDSAVGVPRPQLVTVPSLDVSPYGCHGLAGNIQEWCADVSVADGPAVHEGRVVIGGEVAATRPERIVRGGHWSDNAAGLRAARRTEVLAATRVDRIGFRLARSVTVHPTG
jgi:serine/threonine-protein kinase